eukprot:11174677-Lingulodinium_polyedra.AAC.1
MTTRSDKTRPDETQTDRHHSTAPQLLSRLALRFRLPPGVTPQSRMLQRPAPNAGSPASLQPTALDPQRDRATRRPDP